MSAVRTELLLDLRRCNFMRWRVLAWLALGVSAVAAALLARHDLRLTAQLEQLQDRNEALSARLHPPATRGVARVPDAREMVRIEHANAVIDQLAVPWGELFRALESADPRGTGLLSLSPNATDRSVRLSGEARTVADVVAYVDRVAAQPSLGQVHLVGYDTVARDGVQVISFTVSAKWKQR